MSARVAFIGFFSPLASVRREILFPARALAIRGVATHVISLATWPAAQVREIIDKADRVVFGKLLAMPGEETNAVFGSQAEAYRAVMHGGSVDGRAIFCFADDHFDAPKFAAFYRDVAPISRAWIASSQALKNALEARASCPVFSYPEVAEMPRAPARVPRHSLGERIGLWVARRARVGIDPWRLKLLWFGHPTNVTSLLQELPALRAFAAKVPLVLECVTQPTPELARMATPTAGMGSTALRIIITPWALESMPPALADCDVVILPQLVNDPQKRSKSNNRLVDALQAGRFVVAHPLPSYEELRDFCWIGESIAEGLNWLLGHPREALTRIVSGQRYLERHHSLDALGDFWMKALAL